MLLQPGDRLAGPAIVEERESTVVIGMDAWCSVDRYGNMIVDIRGRYAEMKVHAVDRESKFDPVTLQIIWSRIVALVDESAATLVRTSFSTLVRESNDFSCVVTDVRGNSLAQSTASIPSFIGTLPATVKILLKEFPPESLRPGDVLITNDMHIGTGHLPDVNVARPVFKNGRMVAVAASVAHAPDIGGKLRAPDPREVFEEGLQIPMMKLADEGRLNEQLLKIVRANVRVPDQVVGI